LHHIRDWKLDQFVRKDVLQADIAPLAASLVGIPYPRNSVGVLPYTYLMEGEYRAQAVATNARQVYAHAHMKEEMKELHTLFLFKPFGPLRTIVPQLLQDLKQKFNQQQFQAVENISQIIIEHSLEGLRYFQHYDWFFLMTTITMGYIGWVVVLYIAASNWPFHVSSFFGRSSPQISSSGVRSQWEIDVKLVGTLFATSFYLSLENSPVMYYLYVAFPVIFWRFIWHERHTLMESWSNIPTSYAGAVLPQSNSASQQIVGAFIILLCLQLIIVGYSTRGVFSMIFVIIGFWPKWIVENKCQIDISRNFISSKQQLYTSFFVQTNLFTF